jgi:hypothetical protein
MRYCPSCMRHVTTDTIKAFRFNSVLVPAFIICTWCGWCIDTQEKP